MTQDYFSDKAFRLPIDYLLYAQPFMMGSFNTAFGLQVHQGKLDEHDSRRYFQQLIEAVAHCHSKGVYHRDLKVCINIHFIFLLENVISIHHILVSINTFVLLLVMYSPKIFFLILMEI